MLTASNKTDNMKCASVICSPVRGKSLHRHSNSDLCRERLKLLPRRHPLKTRSMFRINKCREFIQTRLSVGPTELRSHPQAKTESLCSLVRPELFYVSQASLELTKSTCLYLQVLRLRARVTKPSQRQIILNYNKISRPIFLFWRPVESCLKMVNTFFIKINKQIIHAATEKVVTPAAPPPTNNHPHHTVGSHAHTPFSLLCNFYSP